MNEKKPFLLPYTKITTPSVSNSTENRGRGNDAKKVILKSINVNMDVPASFLDQLTTSNEDFSYQEEFFSNDGKPKDLNIPQLPYANEYNDQIIIISDDKEGKINPIRLISKKIHKFSAALKPGTMAQMHLQIQIYPSSNDNWTPEVTDQIDQLLVRPHYLRIEKSVQVDLGDDPNQDSDSLNTPKGTLPSTKKKKTTKENKKSAKKSPNGRVVLPD